jgi:hypothetical protein
MAVAYEITPDDVRDGGIVVDDDDPSWWIGIVYQGCPFLSAAMVTPLRYGVNGHPSQQSGQQRSGSSSVRKIPATAIGGRQDIHPGQLRTFSGILRG